MAGRFPGARNVDEFWQNLVDGRESLSFFADDELEPGRRPTRWRRAAQPNYVRARGILDDVELFDAEFFGFTPSEAESSTRSSACSSRRRGRRSRRAGYDPRAFDGPIGVFAGMSNNYYFLQNLLARDGRHRHRRLADDDDGQRQGLPRDAGVLQARPARPGAQRQTACSTSLVAVCTAVQSLLSYQCDMALAGGVSITLPQRRGYLYQEGGITSPDGHCRPFDARRRRAPSSATASASSC